MTDRTTKLFTTGRSQAVRLPLESRFQGKEVFICRDPETGEASYPNGRRPGTDSLPFTWKTMCPTTSWF